jgi:hypothetical protein
MKKKQELESGIKFGMLTIVESNKSRKSYYNVICDCGNKKIVRLDKLTSGLTKSCGCSRGLKHGLGHTSIYRIWLNMKTRCNNPNNVSYLSYGGRGIKYDPKWGTFEGFYEDMAEEYSKELSIDRINVNDNYYKDNCRWVTMKDQARNRRDNVCVNTTEGTFILLDLCKKLNLKYSTVTMRLHRGWPMDKALNYKIQLI